MKNTNSDRLTIKTVKVTTDKLCKIDIRILKRQHTLQSSTQGTFEWTLGGQRVGKAIYEINSNTLSLNYTTNLENNGRKVLFFRKQWSTNV